MGDGYGAWVESDGHRKDIGRAETDEGGRESKCEGEEDGRRRTEEDKGE